MPDSPHRKCHAVRVTRTSRRTFSASCPIAVLTHGKLRPMRLFKREGSPTVMAVLRTVRNDVPSLLRRCLCLRPRLLRRRLRSQPSSAMLRRLMGLAGLQGGYLNSSESKNSIRIDLRPKMWQLTSVVVCCGLVSSVVCVLLVVAISAVSWFSWRSGVLQRPAGWLSEVQ